MAKLVRKGGKGSGNWGHAGRPGKVGGSAPRKGGGASVTSGGSVMSATPMFGETDDTIKLNRWISARYENARQNAINRIAEDTGLDPIDVEVILDEYHNGEWGDPEIIDAAMAMAFGDTFGLTYDGKLDETSLEYAQKVATVMKSMYNQTQSDLSGLGVKEVETYRLITWDYGSDGLGKMRPGDEVVLGDGDQGWVSIRGYAVTATSGGNTTNDSLFALVKTYVPADRILSTGVTGFGSTQTSDVIVIGSGGEKDTAVVDATNRLPHDKAQDFYSSVDESPRMSVSPNSGDDSHDVNVDLGLLDTLGDSMGVNLRGGGEYSGLSLSPDGIDRIVKNDVVSHLSETTGLGYDGANAFVHQWAKTSNAHEDSAFIQATAKRLFGDKLGTDFSEFQKKSFESYGNDSAREGFADKQDIFNSESPSEARGTADKLMKEMYNRTQEQLDELGVDGVWLYRGIVGNTNNINKGDKISLDENAMESWTSSKEVAEYFSNDDFIEHGYVVKSFVPRERILSTPYSGFGCRFESEYVVIGGGDKSDGKQQDRVDVVEVVEVK